MSTKYTTENNNTPLETTLEALAMIPELKRLHQETTRQMQIMNESIQLLFKEAKARKKHGRDVYTVKEAAQLLGGICEESVRRKIRAGQLETMKGFRKKLILKDSLEKYIKDTS